MGEGRVEGGIGEGKLGYVADLEPDVQYAALGRQQASTLDLRRLEVEPDHLARCRRFGQPDGDRAGAASAVE